MFVDEVLRKSVVTGRHRRVRREHRLRGHLVERFGGADAFGHHAVPYHLEPGKGAVAFIEVQHAG